MSVTSKLANSIWPNGMDVDSEGYATFYPLGTNKVNIPTNSPYWPKGDKLVSPFIYKNNKLVGFCDTKAMINDGNTVITMPYEHIEIELPNIDKGTLQIHAPKATTKKVSWKNGSMEDIVDVDYKYKGCKTVDDVLAIGKDYFYNTFADIASDGSWTEFLSDLENGNTNSQITNTGLFYDCATLTSFNSDLSSLTNGRFMFSHTKTLKSFDADLSSLTDGARMFYYCSALTTFISDLSNLTEGDGMFSRCNFNMFNTDLSSLTIGSDMFSNCSNLTSFRNNLSSLTNGYNMFYYCTNLTTFNADLSSLVDGSHMFDGCSKLGTFSYTELSSLANGNKMFYQCTALHTFTPDLSSLTNGESMFNGCSNLRTFTSDLSSLTNGDYMFTWCTNLGAFSYTELSSLANGNYMFYGCTALHTFTPDLSSLEDGYMMFLFCLNLYSFNSDLSSLEDGRAMFYECSNLTSFNSDLSSLTEGLHMFYGCKLNTASIKNISETIAILPSAGAASIHIGIGNTTPTEEEHTYLSEIHKKNWNVYVNGSSNAYVPATATTDETGEIQETPIPFYAKPESTTEEKAKYIDSNGNFYNILGGQFIYVDDPETYGMFLNEEDAAANMGLTIYIKPETNIENEN